MEIALQEQVGQLIRTGQYYDALAILNECQYAEPDDWLVHYFSGVAYRFIGDFEKAIALQLSASKLMPGEASIFHALGIAYQMSGRYPKAIEAFEGAIALRKYYFEAYNSLGLTYRKMDRHEKALESYEKGAKLLMEIVTGEVRKDPSLCYKIEVVDGKETRTLLPYYFSKTIELLKSDINYAMLRSNTGVCLAVLGDTETARKCFLDAIECTPDGYNFPDPVRHLRNLSS